MYICQSHGVSGNHLKISRTYEHYINTAVKFCFSGVDIEPALVCHTMDYGSAPSPKCDTTC